MEITRETIRLALYITGPLVIASYIYGVTKMDDPNDLWGEFLNHGAR